MRKNNRPTQWIAVDPNATSQPEDWGEYYVKSLRLIGFQEGRQILNRLTQAKIQRGTLDLYAVANEEAGGFTGATFPATATQEALRALPVAAQSSYDTPGETHPLLMSAHIHPVLLQQENSLEIALERTLAKVELLSVAVNGTPMGSGDYTYSLSASGKAS